MKVLQISDTIEKIWGAEKVIYDIKKLLEKNNHEVFLWWTNMRVINQSIFSIFNLKYFLKLKKYLRNSNFNVIHIHKFNSILSPAIFLAIPKNTKIILHVHDFSFFCYKLWVTINNKQCDWWVFHKNCKQYSNRKLEFIFNFMKWLKFIINRFFIKKYIDIFLCPSKELQQSMINSLKLRKEKFIYLPNFINIEENYFPDFNNIINSQFLFVWRISKEKWIEIAIKAFDILVNKEWINDIKLNIIWYWSKKNNLVNLVKFLKLEKNIKFLWKIDNKDLKKYYEESIWLIMPSIWLENNPLVAIEWLKFWKPIIASNIWWYPDLIENWKNGYLFKIWDYVELSEKIKNLYKNNDLSIFMWNYWFEKLKTKFNSKKYLLELNKIYKN